MVELGRANRLPVAPAAKTLHERSLDGIGEREVDLLRQHRRDQRLEERGAGGDAQTAEPGNQRRQHPVLARQAVEWPDVEVGAQDVPELSLEGGGFEGGAGRTLQFHRQPRPGNRTGAGNRGQGELAASGKVSASAAQETSIARANVRRLARFGSAASLESAMGLDSLGLRSFRPL